MDYVPPVVIEQARPSDFDAGRIMAKLYFRRELESIGVDFEASPRLFVGGRYGDTAQTLAGPVYDSRWILKVTLRY